MKNLKKFYALSFSVLLMFCFWGCTKDKPDLRWEANVLSFYFKGYESYQAVIEGSSVIVNLPSEAEEDVTQLVPVVDVSLGATTYPSLEFLHNFEAPVSFKVISEDGQNHQAYTVIVNVQSGFASYKKLSSFTLADGTYSPVFTPYNNRTVAISNEYVYVTSTAPGGDIFWMTNNEGDALSDEKKLSKGSQGVIAGGTFALSTVRTSGEAIYASNLAIGGSAVFRVYKWADRDDPEPKLFFEFPHYGANLRLGDAITVWGDLSGNGAIVAYNKTSGNTFYKFNVTNGVASPAPELIVSEVGSIGSYGQLTRIDEENCLLTGSTIAPALLNPNGALKHAIPPGVMEPGALVGSSVFTYNKARYMAAMLYDLATNIQRLLIYDISGNDLLATFKSINSSNIASRNKFNLVLGEDVPNGNLNLAGSTDFLLKDGKALVVGLAPNSGLVIYEFSK